MNRYERKRCWSVVVVLGVVAAAGFVGGLAGPAWGVEIKLTADDAAGGDQFGRAVAISGGTALVGARYDDDDGTDSGSAYLFDAATGSQLHKLNATDAAADDNLGVSVAVLGSMALVGADGDDDAGSDSGAAYLFNVTDGGQLHKLTATDAAANDWFGRAVALGSTRALVGAYGDDDGGEASGSVYVFDLADGGQLDKLTAMDADSGDYFGYSLAASGNTAIIGAYQDDDAGVSSGSAYLFNISSGQELRKLVATDAAADDYFGVSVAISGNRALVGAIGDDDVGPGSDSGAVYVFEVSSGMQLAKLTATDAAANDWFGYSVALSGHFAIVGAYLNDDGGNNTGSTYVFDITTGQQLAKLAASDATPSDYFGYSVALSGSRALIGAYLNDDAGTSSGSAYLYTIVPEPATWALLVIGLTTLPRVRPRTSRRA